MWLSCFAQDHFITHTRKIYKDGISCAAARGINLHNMCAAWEAEDAHWRAPPIMITGRQKSLILKAKMLGRLMAGNRLHLYHAAVVIRFLILSCALMHWWQPFHQEESEIWSFNGGDCRKAECTFFLAVCQCDQAVHLFEDLSWLVSNDSRRGCSFKIQKCDDVQIIKSYTNSTLTLPITGNIEYTQNLEV